MVYVAMCGEFNEGVEIIKIFAEKENAIKYAKEMVRNTRYIEEECSGYVFYAASGCEFYAVESWEVE